MSLSHLYPNAPYAAEQLVNAIEWQQADQYIAQAQAGLVASLGGRVDLYAQMTEQGRMLYLLALVVKGGA